MEFVAAKTAVLGTVGLLVGAGYPAFRLCETYFSAGGSAAAVARDLVRVHGLASPRQLAGRRWAALPALHEHGRAVTMLARGWAWLLACSPPPLTFLWLQPSTAPSRPLLLRAAATCASEGLQTCKIVALGTYAAGTWACIATGGNVDAIYDTRRQPWSIAFGVGVGAMVGHWNAPRLERVGTGIAATLVTRVGLLVLARLQATPLQ